MISQVITLDSHRDFTDEELFPIKEIRYTDTFKTGAYGPVTLLMKNGSQNTVCFEDIEGQLVL